MAQTPTAPPTKLSRVVVGFPAGGATDIAARALVDRLHPAYPAGIIVESKPGASGRLAVEFIKTSAPDGSSMLFTPDFVMTVYPHSYKKLSYDPLQDFTPVAACAKGVLAFSVGPAVPDSILSIKDFIGWVKANPSQGAYASTSAGATPHFAGMMFSKAAAINLNHVPYKGGAPAIQDLMGGHIAMSVNPIAELLPHLKSGRLRVLATTGRERSRFLPDVPSMVEVGYPDVVTESWLGLLMPAKTPAAVVSRAASWVNQVLNTVEMRDAYAALGLDTVQGTPESFAALLKSGVVGWGPVVKASGFAADE